MTSETRVHIRRVDPAASAPVIVAARLTAEFGDGHQVRGGDATAEPALLCVTSSEPDLPERVAATLGEARFRGWTIVEPHDDPR